MTPTPSEIRARMEKITSWPWYEDGSEVRHDFDPHTSNKEIADCSIQICEVGRISKELDRGKFDRTFIAHAPADINFLLGEVERLRDEVASMVEWLAANGHTSGRHIVLSDWHYQCDACRRLTAALAALEERKPL